MRFDCDAANCDNLEIGPGVEVIVVGGGSSFVGIYYYGLSVSDGLVIDGVRFGSRNGGSFYKVVDVNYARNVVVQNCVVESMLPAERSLDTVLELRYLENLTVANNMVHAQESKTCCADVIRFKSVSHVVFQNNVIETFSQEVHHVAIEIEDSEDMVIQHNTFFCFQAFDIAFLRVSGQGSGIFLHNNLFAGNCHHNGEHHLIEVSQSDDSSFVGCNRASEGITKYFRGPEEWVIACDSVCPEDVGLSKAIGFVSGDSPFPDLAPAEPYLGTYGMTAELTCTRGVSLDPLLTDVLGTLRPPGYNFMGAWQDPRCANPALGVSEVCNNQGTCGAAGTCACWNHSKYTGELCEVRVCFGQAVTNETGVCSENGNCVAENDCQCNQGWDNSDCSDYQCEGKNGWNLAGTSCRGHGNCSFANRTCVCMSDWSGPFCGLPVCFGLNSVEACSKHGKCIFPGKCDCNPGWESDYRCNDGIGWNLEGTACSGHGNCSFGNRSCVCDDKWTGGDSCDVPVCSTGCSQQGKCIWPDKCACDSGWENEDCSDYQCEDGIGWNLEGTACSGHGNCSFANRTCVCEDKWTGDDTCDVPVCSSGCSQHGKCVWPDQCACYSGWENEDCSDFQCADGIGWNLEGTACSGHGNCSFANRACVCDRNWADPFCQLCENDHRSAATSCSLGWTGNNCSTQKLLDASLCRECEDESNESEAALSQQLATSRAVMSVFVVVSFLLAIVAIVVVIVVCLKNARDRAKVKSGEKGESSPDEDEELSEVEVVRSEVLSTPMSPTQSRRMSMSIRVVEFALLESAFQSVRFVLDESDRRGIELVGHQKSSSVFLDVDDMGPVDMNVIEEKEIVQVGLEMNDGTRKMFDFHVQEHVGLTRCFSCLYEVCL